MSIIADKVGVTVTTNYPGGKPSSRAKDHFVYDQLPECMEGAPGAYGLLTPLGFTATPTATTT